MFYLQDCIRCINNGKDICLKNKNKKKCNNDTAELYLNIGKLENENNVKLTYFKKALNNCINREYQDNYTIKMVFELHQLIINIYWEKNDYDAIKKIEESYYYYYKKYLKVIDNQDSENIEEYKLYGSESLLELVEFCIISKNIEKYKYYLNEFIATGLTKNRKFRKSFGYVLYILYENIGNMIFYKNRKVLQKVNKIQIISYYYWEFNTITDFINKTNIKKYINNEKSDKYDIMIQEKTNDLLELIDNVSIMQKNIISNLLSNKFAFTKNRKK